MDLYSVTLGLGLIAAIAALGLALHGRFWPRQARRLPRAAAAVAVVGLALVVVSGVNHRMVGHPSGSPSALDPAAFLGEHPALLITAGLAIAALLLLRIAGPLTRE